MNHEFEQALEEISKEVVESACLAESGEEALARVKEILRDKFTTVHFNASIASLFACREQWNVPNGIDYPEPPLAPINLKKNVNK